MSAICSACGQPFINNLNKSGHDACGPKEWAAETNALLRSLLRAERMANDGVTEEDIDETMPPKREDAR